MPRGLRKKTKQYVLDRFQEEDPEEYFKYKTKSSHGLTEEQLEFVQAVECHSVQKIRLMLNRGVDPNFVIVQNRRLTPLHLAVLITDGVVCEKIMGVMLFFGADPNAKDSEGRSPLHDACFWANLVALRLLIQAGGDVNQVDNIHETPLLCACRCISEQTIKIVDLLLSSGALVSCTNENKQTVLHKLADCDSPPRAYISAAEDRHKIMEMCLRHGVSASAVDNQGLSPLCYEVVHLFATPQVQPDKMAAARVLVAGGAVLQFLVLEEIDSQLGRGGSQVLRTFFTFISEFRTILPTRQSNLLIDVYSRHCQRISSRLPANQLQAFESSVENVPNLVPNLAQLSRQSIKSALGGLVYPSVKLLPLPNKIQEFICGTK